MSHDFPKSGGPCPPSAPLARLPHWSIAMFFGLTNAPVGLFQRGWCISLSKRQPRQAATGLHDPRMRHLWLRVFYCEWWPAALLGGSAPTAQYIDLDEQRKHFLQHCRGPSSKLLVSLAPRLDFSDVLAPEDSGLTLPSGVSQAASTPRLAETPASNTKHQYCGVIVETLATNA